MFKLILTNGKEDLDITFKVRNTPIARKWFRELSNNYPLFETDRFTNWGEHNLVDQLKSVIRIINDYDKTLKIEIPTNIKQADLNYLHKFFEELRGEKNSRTLWYDNAPDNIKTTLNKLNVYIHQLESEIRTKNHPSLTVTFKERPNIELAKNDLKHFDFRWSRGTVYIEYPHVGKTVLDVFKDKDHVTKAVRPQTHYSADFTVKFGPTVPYWFYILRKMYINVWLYFQDFKFTNYNIGMIPVADIITPINIDYLKKFNKVKQVICIN